MPTSVDVVGVVDAALREDNWGKDGLLHPSSDLTGSLRHSQLRLAGAPRKSESFASLVRLKTGTMWHEWLGAQFEDAGVPVMREVPANDGLPEGWGGTADFLVWDRRHNAYVLMDLKTTKGEGIKYILRDGAKTEHIWQISAYWHAFVNMGLPMLDRVGVIYLPMNEVYSDEPVQPTIQEVAPLPRERVWDVMKVRWTLTQDYLRTVDPYDTARLTAFLSDKLAPEQPREQKLFKARDKWEVKLVPHWSAQFCPYEPPLCSCSEQGVTKVGEFVRADLMLPGDGEWVYQPRAGYEELEPVVAPA